MPGSADFRSLSYTRLKTVRILLNNNDWEGAAYMMGYVLETLLKACTCKALRLEQYPDHHTKHDDKLVNVFMTHRFDNLLIVSGLSDLFLPVVSGTNPKVTYNWSQFTSSYPGDWPSMRYRTDIAKDFPQTKVRELYEYLYEIEHSIVKAVQRAKRW